MLLGASLATVKSPDEFPSKMIRFGRGCCSVAIRNRPAPTHFGVWERSWSGKAKTEPRIWVARGRLCPDGGALWGRAQPNMDSIPPTSSAPLYRLNHCFGLVAGTGEPRELADKAAIKAMLVNRVGDFGLAPGILGCFTLFQTVDFSTIFARASAPRNSWISCNMRLNAITLICILLFIGAVGKSAQIGSHTWSPDAMEGPTPVSALIHAATMVTAGVFMIARCSPLFEYPPTALIVITFVGAMTSFLKTTTAILQNDLKRVIAYSTCSQLGYMIFSCGIYNYSVSVFHLMNHAFFKALLFLSTGSVIHAMSDEQDMRKMGGLASSFPFTYAMMLMGSLSLIGFPFLTGFYSKDVILELAYTKYTISGNFAFWLGSVSVLFTSYYSFRSLFLTFLVPTNSFGRYILRWHDAPIPMAIPLVLLALGSLFVGYLAKV
ncbi:NADH-ubiquinone oxidoreductase chain 5 [Capsicum annuum]|nr:NADH-ubiquinone oxidoreductase chain 5 [Capsicum annuum]